MAHDLRQADVAVVVAFQVVQEIGRVTRVLVAAFFG